MEKKLQIHNCSYRDSDVATLNARTINMHLIVSIWFVNVHISVPNFVTIKSTTIIILLRGFFSEIQ